MNSQKKQALVLSDGAIQAYRVAGKGNAAAQPVVVCLHGWAMSGRWFNDLSTALSPTYAVVTPDLRGHGDSETGDRPLTIELLAKDLHFFLNSIKALKVVLVAWSMGAMVAWKAMELGLKSSVLGLVVVDMSPRIVNDNRWTLGMTSTTDSWAKAGLSNQSLRQWQATAQRIARRILAPDRVDSPLVAQLAADVARNDPSALSGLWKSMLTQDFRSAVKLLPVRTLVLYGLHSQLYQPAVSQYLCSSAPHGSIRAFDRSGHAPHLEQPDSFNESVYTFVAECAAGSASAGEVNPDNQK